MSGRTLVLSVLALTGTALPAAADCAWQFGPPFPPFTQRKHAAAVNQNGTLVLGDTG